VVCTELIRSQLGWGKPEVLFASSDDPAGFAAACLQLYSDPDVWRQAREAALARIIDECSAEHMRITLQQTVQEALSANFKGRYA
jgi:O-antigen biosynthesis protein